MANKQKTIEAQKWDVILAFFKKNFTKGDSLGIDGVIFLIGSRELGIGYKKFKKDEKMDVMHIAVCRLLEPYGFYEFDFFDEAGWPHYKLLEQLPLLSRGEQEVMMKKAVIRYFDEEEILVEEFQAIEVQKL
ncbi:MAG: hypothetical protein ACK5HU_02575 [Flavobacteriales bacterium]